MTDHHDDDEALVARVAARQAAHLGWPVPTDLDPHRTRRELGNDRRTMAVAVWALRRDGAHTPDVIDAALDGQPPSAAFNLPPGVAGVIFGRVPDHHKGAVFDALDAELTRFAGGPGTRPLAELCVHRIAEAVRSAIVASVAADVAEEWADVVDDAGHPFTDAQIEQAAAGATDLVVIPALVDRLREDLLALAGMP